MYLASTRLGDTLVSVGMDKVAKVWKIARGLLYPIRYDNLNCYEVTKHSEVAASEPWRDCGLFIP